MIKQYLFFVSIALSLMSCATDPPKPLGPLPSERQLAWQELEYYAFFHFNMNTFTDMEWGLGGEDPSRFNPTALDVNQWVETVKKAGMKGVIITAKHHDGFCLWPTKTTEHSIKNSPYKDGKGDIVKELAEASKKHGLKFGVYLSPWDRNSEYYGTDKYVDIFHEQLRELLTNYGPIFEVWFDGANGGTGYYGGANEMRKIDNKTYYKWDKTQAIIRELQPDAVIFGDNGPDIRWVGNEQGWANETNWSIMRRDEIYPGWPRYKELRGGHDDGTHWLPAECDVSIRPGWYYHASEDHQVKSLTQLLDIYYHSIGRNSNLLLNIPVDRRGLIHPRDSIQLMRLKEQIDKDFAEDLALTAEAEVSSSRGRGYEASVINDAKEESYWASGEGVDTATVILNFKQPIAFNRIALEEYIRLGQRVSEFTVEAEVDGQWQLIDEQTTIGNKRILRFNTVNSSKIRVRITASKGEILLSNISVYNAPTVLVAPVVERAKDGTLTLEIPDTTVEVYYTLDGTEPSLSSSKYTKPFLVEKQAMLKMFAYNPMTEQRTGITEEKLEISKNNWSIVQGDEKTGQVIDANSNSFWTATASDQNQVIIDLGGVTDLKGFSYTPMQARFPHGIITDYEFSISMDAKQWVVISKGEFGNIVNNRIRQEIYFKPSKARFIKLKATKVAGEKPNATFGEIGILQN
ncbi:alpha-L-fucosidase [Galbibacter sp.]|uniref:alpha-L-fucosidase n=1 Tax=Galbibacter sp. TaxID=2918471 RepID=UPI003A90946B